MAVFRLSAVLVVALLSLLGASPAWAQTAAQLSAAADLTVLNYALTLENLESTFYNQGLAAFNSAAFVTAGYNSSVYGYLQMVQAHENSHVAFLTAAINAASPNSAVPACTYNFTNALSSPTAFITTAAALENAGQTAYDGAVNGITTAAYATVAAQIATVEARHAAYLNELIGASPFPQSFDNATLPAKIAAAIAPFLLSCPYNITLPTIRPSGVALNSANQVVATGVLGPSYSAAQQSNDITALNYALTLENFESAFYQYGLATFSYAAFTAASFPAYYYNYTVMIAGHEALHAATLTTVINGRVSNAAVAPCTYNFSSVNTVASFLATAQVLENTGVMAYDGAVSSITDTNLQQVAATIATVEARHAAFLNQANGASPFPNNQDNGTAPATIIAAVVATGFISCPYTPVGPVVIIPSDVSSTGSPASTAGSNGAALAALPVNIVVIAATALLIAASAML